MCKRSAETWSDAESLPGFSISPLPRRSSAPSWSNRLWVIDVGKAAIIGPSDMFEPPGDRRSLLLVCRLIVATLLCLALLAGCHQVGPPIGDWSLVRSGSWENLTWQLFATPVQDGGRCLAIETNPELAGRRVVPTSDLYKGHLANCLLRPGLGSSRYANIADDIESPDGIHVLIGGTAPSVRNLRVLFKDSENSVDTSDGYFVMFYRAGVEPVALEPVDQNGVAEKHCPAQTTAVGVRFRC